MYRRFWMLTILGAIWALGTPMSSVLPEENRLSFLQTSQNVKGILRRAPIEETQNLEVLDPKLPERFLPQIQRSREVNGRLPIKKIRRTFNEAEKVKSLNNFFNDKCLPSSSGTVNSKIMIDPACLDAVVTLGITGGEEAGIQIIKFLSRNEKSDFRAKTVGLEALAYWVNVTRKTSDGESDGTIDFFRRIGFNKLVACIPKKSIFPHEQRLNEQENKNSLELINILDECTSPLSVDKERDRDEIRHKLKNLALSGDTRANGVFEDMLEQAPPVTSYYAFLEALSEAHKRVAEKNGVECYFEVNNRECS